MDDLTIEILTDDADYDLQRFDCGEEALNLFLTTHLVRQHRNKILLEEVLRNNPGVSCWWMADAGVEDRGVMTAFMRALGFTAQQGGWEKR